jgi:hypothetical protein
MKSTIFWDINRVVRWKSTTFRRHIWPPSTGSKNKPSKKPVSKQMARRDTCFHDRFLLGLFFDPEDEGHMFLRNVGWLSTDYTMLYSRRFLFMNVTLCKNVLLGNWVVRETYLYEGYSECNLIGFMQLMWERGELVHSRWRHMTHCLANHHVTGHLVFVLVSTEWDMMCPAIDNPASCEMRAVIRFFTLKTWVLRKSFVNCARYMAKT